jgi:hypothetical protein
MKRIALLALAMSAVLPIAAHATSPLWDSMIYSPNHNKYRACILSKRVDTSGYIETWCKLNYNNKVFYAQATADQAKYHCNATGDASCVSSDPTWFGLGQPKGVPLN